MQASENFLHRTVNHGAKPRVVEPSTELIAMNTFSILTAWPEEVPASVPADMIMSKPYALSELRQAMAHVLGSPPPLSAAGDAAA